MLWRSLVRHLTDFDQAVDCGAVITQIPQLYFEKFTEHRLESLVEPSETEEETVLLLRTSFPTFVRLESTQVMATKPADGRRAFYGCDHCRDISFYDEYVFPVTCERTGIPMVWDPGGFIITSNLKAGSSRRSQNPSFERQVASFPARVKSHLWRRCTCCLLSRLSQPRFQLIVFNIFLQSVFSLYSIFFCS